MPSRRASWREPVLWLVVGLPLVALIASTVMIRLALRDPADASGSSTRRIAQIQLEDLSWDREAARRGVRVLLEADAPGGEIRVRLSPDDGQPASLDLVMRHPTQAAQDRVLALVRDGTQWRARTSSWAVTQAWELQLASPTQHWRVAGRLTSRATETVLVPQVGR
jgi:hypothetical protein